MTDAIRLVVCDVDGTLVDKQKRLSPGNIAAIGRLREAGVAFTLISARPRSGLVPIADTLALDVPMAAFNGGIVFRRDGQMLAHHPIPADVARGVLALAEGAPVDTWLFADDLWYASDPNGPHTASERRASAQEPVETTDYAALATSADKITFVSDDEDQLKRLAERMTANFGDHATIVQSQPYYLDVTATAANKGDGLAALADAFGVTFGNIAAIGDQANDLPMLARAGVSIAMGNAPAAVQAAAGALTLGNDADGVAHAIDTLILRRP